MQPCLQLYSFTARAGQNTADDEALARALQQELNSDSSAGRKPSSLAEADLALARKVQDEALRESSGRSTARLPGACVI